ncbi:MAG: DUF2027 domain-containing protein, partial [Bacteroidales bacterium]|nr:DUF2027 domain-containing protein [Bacteroidales bacterium]
NDVGGGTVTRIEKTTVFVENDDGFEVPVVASQLLKTETASPDLALFANTAQTNHSQHTEKEPKEQHQSVPAVGYIDLSDDHADENSGATVNLWIAWVANRDKTAEANYDVYLVNDCSYNILYVVATLSEGAFRGLQAGRLDNDSIIHLTTLSGNDLKRISQLDFQVIFFKQGNYVPQEPVNYRFEIDEFYLTDPVNYRTTEFLDDKALLINITQETLLAEIERNAVSAVSAKIERQKKAIDTAQPHPAPPKEPENKEEVDLHIEQLTDNYKHLTPTEALDMQISRFKIALEGAIRNKQKSIIFIHGVGNGRLRLEVQRTLARDYPKLRYQDASFKEYGYGATLVFCK